MHTECACAVSHDSKRNINNISGYSNFPRAQIFPTALVCPETYALTSPGNLPERLFAMATRPGRTPFSSGTIIRLSAQKAALRHDLGSISYITKQLQRQRHINISWRINMWNFGLVERQNQINACTSQSCSFHPFVLRVCDLGLFGSISCNHCKPVCCA